MEYWYKYDVVISFAQEDVVIARVISKALKKKGIKAYFYMDENHWGKDLYKTTQDVYHNRANCGIVIASLHYVNKRTTMLELRTMLNARRKKILHNLLILKTDENIEIPGVSNNEIYALWQNNPKKVADDVYRKLCDYSLISPCIRDNALKIVAIVSLIVALTYYVAKYVYP